jgi:hypothetical protein
VPAAVCSSSFPPAGSTFVAIALGAIFLAAGAGRVQDQRGTRGRSCGKQLFAFSILTFRCSPCPPNAAWIDC